MICNSIYDTYNRNDNVYEPNSEGLKGVEIGSVYTQSAVESIPGFGNIFVTISLLFFAFTTVMAYYYIAECNVAYLTKYNNHKWIIHLLRFVLLGVPIYGSIQNSKLIWGLGDIGVGLMSFLNIIALFLLRKPAMKSLRDYETQIKQGKDPTFEPKKLDIENAELLEVKN